MDIGSLIKIHWYVNLHW